MNKFKRIISPRNSEHKSPKKQKLITDFARKKPITEIKVKQTAVDCDILDGDDIIFIDDFEEKVSQEKIEKKLNLSEWTRCCVTNIDRDTRSFDLILTVTSEKNAQSAATCRLQASWFQTKIEIGDIISIIAKWNEQLNAFIVDSAYGFCVVNPDNLISNTSVVGSLFCMRKSVLQQNFSGIDPPNKIMVIGTLIHQLFQEVLTHSLKSRNEIEARSKSRLNSREAAFTLYESQMSRKEITHEMDIIIPQIVSFTEQYFEGKMANIIPKDVFQGKITKIDEIEENLWCPTLGVKGKIDVSVRVRRWNGGNKFQDISQIPIPLELKTGRATFSNEHKGQVFLYQMMLNAQGVNANSGLLLYLRDGIMKEIHASRNDQRELVVIRNELDYYLNRSLPMSDTQLLVEGKLLQPFELPDPISHHSACSSCPYATICCTFGKTDQNLNFHSSHPWQQALDASTSHLKQTDFEYFIHWCKILLLENKETDKSYNIRSLWTETPETRQRNGAAIINLRLKTKVQTKESKFLHEFYSEEGMDLTFSKISIGEYVIISSRNRVSIASGFVYDITKSTISISSERNLLKKYANQTFIVDKYESKSSNVFNFTNLGILLDSTERATELREIVIDRKIPKFGKVLLPKAMKSVGTSILQELNSIQRNAALKSLSTNSFMLIKGLPGTGKTQTLVAIVRLFHLIGKSIIITSHTHSAVDNLLLRLKSYSLPMIRLGSASRIHPQLNAISEDSLTANCNTEIELEKVYASMNIVGVTCLGSSHSIFSHRKFDVCIVDEATQILQATILRPLFFCEKFILVGDPDQLPPVIRSKEARKLGANESLFHRLDSSEATNVLNVQYRMNKTITKLANEITYNGSLKCGSKEVEMATIKLPIENSASLIPRNGKWLQLILHSHIDQSVYFLDTKNCSERNATFTSHKELTKDPRPGCTPPSRRLRSHSMKYTNYCEAAIIFHLIKLLLSFNYDPDRIGVIAPYSNQVDLLRRLTEQYQVFHCGKGMDLDFSSVEINTVDQYQGRDKDIIFYSCSRTGTLDCAGAPEGYKELEILEDKRRLTVAITRAKYKLIIVGDANYLQQYTPFRDLLSKIPTRYKMELESEKNGFNWQDLLSELKEASC